MNDNAKAWVAALRSGKYEQGRGYLRDECDRFCCLGIACDLAVEAGVIETPELGEGAYNYNLMRHSLPRRVCDWLCMKTDWGNYGGENESLAHQNDTGVPFAEIADLIESEPKGLFA